MSAALPIWIYVVFLIAYIGVVTAIWIWRINRRRERPPLAEKLLRGPGESLRRRLERLDERLGICLATCACVPALVLCGGLKLALSLASADGREAGFVFSLLLFSAALAACAWWLMHTLTLRRDCHLGLYGEKAVAEALAPLAATGHRIFHDVPGESGRARFNLDHVVVGPGGVFAIETKTRRKGRALPGRKEHEIIFDGKRLVFPWGEDTHGLAQARRQAEWLAQWIQQLTGERLPVTPVLTFPGWWVSSTAAGDIRVVNPKQLGAALAAECTPAKLTPRQIDLIARQLDARCRDVEF